MAGSGNTELLQKSCGMNIQSKKVMMLDIPTTQRFINDCVSFHFDIVQGMSRQYMTSPVAFAMGRCPRALAPGLRSRIPRNPKLRLN
ncbi:unnamed protein product [Symbiodinium sp. KB8]|nr:unnamed protein product [Symbiodinium sp. KB8]